MNQMKNKEYSYYNVPDIENMKELLSYCADNYGEKTAIWYKNNSEIVYISFSQLKKDADKLGSYLYSIGMKNKHIAILSENTYEWIISYFAVVNGGNAIVPLDKENNAADIKKLTEKADVDLIIHSENYRGEAEYSGVQLLSMNKVSNIIATDNSMADTEYLNCRIDNGAMCAIVFTSGTTGDPKGVMLSHRFLMKDAYHSAQNLYAPEGTVAILPFYHTFGWMACVLDQLILGHGIYLNRSLKRVMNDIKFASPRHMSVVPVFVRAMYNGIWDNAKKQKKDKQLKIWTAPTCVDSTKNRLQ